MELVRNISETVLPVNPVSGMVHYYAELPLFPFFSTVHFILTAVALRNEPGSLQFAFKHPIASCVMTFVVASSGSVLANVMLARPPLELVVNGWSVLVCLLCWYLIFVSPFDICYLLTLVTPIRLTLLIIEEFARAKKVFAGVSLAAAVYPKSLLAMALVGMLKGSGKRWGITVYRLVYQPQSAGKLELLSISFVTKASFLLAIMYASNGINPMTAIVDQAYLMLVGAILLSCVKLWSELKRTSDPFSLPQELTWLLLTALSFPPPASRDVAMVEERAAASSATKKKRRVSFSSCTKNDDSDDDDDNRSHLKRD